MCSSRTASQPRSTLCWTGSFVSALLQMKSQRRSLPYCFPPSSSSIHQLLKEQNLHLLNPPLALLPLSRQKLNSCSKGSAEARIPGGRFKNKVCDFVAALSVTLVPPLSPSSLLKSPKFAGNSQSSTALPGSSMAGALSDGACSSFSLHRDAEVSLEKQCRLGAGESCLGWRRACRVSRKLSLEPKELTK